MASKQTRRSISVPGVVYKELREYCTAHDCTASSVVEEFLRSFLSMPPKAEKSGAVVPISKEERRRKIEEIIQAKASFTF